ncbi:MAG: MFS transporter [Actinomycetia bacterium]|nr:MFS transporter [Actinomycetes bacterium]MCP4959817.1 MFS transporter [Actinomycetes bacterium]
MTPQLRRWLGGGRLLPLAALAGLNLVDEFDRIAYATLTPEIRDAFGSSDAVINSVATLSAVMILLTAVPTGRLSDRVSRVKLSLGAAALWGVASALTGLVPTIGLLILVRLLSGIGRNANEVIHPSLLSDIYEPEVHPRVFFVHRLANPLAQASGIIAGLVSDWVGWRWAFVVLAVPTVLFSVLLSFVHDPPRRGIDEHRRHMGMAEAFVELRSRRSLPRFWAAAFFLAAAAVGIFQLVSVYFEQQFGFGATERGLTQFLVGVGWVSGIVVGARLSDGLDHSMVGRLAFLCAGGFATIAFGAIAVGLSPNSTVALVATTFMASGNGVWQAPYFSVVGRIAPPGMSGQAYASSTIFYALGALLSVPLFIIGDVVSYRLAFCGVAVLAMIASIIAVRAAPLVSADLAE